MTVSSSHNTLTTFIPEWAWARAGATPEDTRCNPFLRGDKTHCPCVTEKTDPRLSELRKSQLVTNSEL